MVNSMIINVLTRVESLTLDSLDIFGAQTWGREGG